MVSTSRFEWIRSTESVFQNVLKAIDAERVSGWFEEWILACLVRPCSPAAMLDKCPTALLVRANLRRPNRPGMHVRHEVWFRDADTDMETYYTHPEFTFDAKARRTDVYFVVEGQYNDGEVDDGCISDWILADQEEAEKDMYMTMDYE